MTAPPLPLHVCLAHRFGPSPPQHHSHTSDVCIGCRGKLVVAKFKVKRWLRPPYHQSLKQRASTKWQVTMHASLLGPRSKRENRHLALQSCREQLSAIFWSWVCLLPCRAKAGGGEMTRHNRMAFYGFAAEALQTWLHNPCCRGHLMQNMAIRHLEVKNVMCQELQCRRTVPCTCPPSQRSLQKKEGLGAWQPQTTIHRMIHPNTHITSCLHFASLSAHTLLM